MREDTLHKINTIANNLTKNERHVISEEKKSLRYLDRVGAMQRALVEDHQTVKDTMRHTERLRERAEENFEIIDKENRDEQAAVQN